MDDKIIRQTLQTSLQLKPQYWSRKKQEETISEYISKKYNWKLCGKIWIQHDTQNIPYILECALIHYHVPIIHELLKGNHIKTIWESNIWNNRKHTRLFFTNKDGFMKRTMITQLQNIPIAYVTTIALNEMIFARQDKLIIAYIKLFNNLKQCVPYSIIKKLIIHGLKAPLIYWRKNCLQYNSLLYFQEHHPQGFYIREWFLLFYVSFDTYIRKNKQPSLYRIINTILLEAIISIIKRETCTMKTSRCQFPWNILCIQTKNEISFFNIIIAMDSMYWLLFILKRMEHELLMNTYSNSQYNFTFTAGHLTSISDTNDTNDCIIFNGSTFNTQIYNILHDTVVSKKGISGIFKVIESYCITNDGWSLLANAVRWGSSPIVKWLLAHSTNCELYAYSYNLSKTHNLLSLAMYNNNIEMLNTVLNHAPFSQLQKDLSHNVDDIVYGAFRNPKCIIPKFKMLLNKKNPSFYFVKSKGQLIYSFLSFAMDDRNLMYFLSNQLLSIPVVFSSEYAYDYILYTFDSASMYDYETFLNVLIDDYHMRNLPILFMLLLQSGKHDFAECIQNHPIFLSEIKSAPDTYRKKFLEYTIQLPIDVHIEKWFSIMRNEWCWVLSKTRWFAFNDANDIWWRIALSYGIKMHFFPFVSENVIVEYSEVWKLHKAFECLSQKLKQQYKVRKYTRQFRFVLFELICRPEKSKLFQSLFPFCKACAESTMVDSNKLSNRPLRLI